MPRFVILRHDLPTGAARPCHWDLMLEQGDLLITWACDSPPRLDATTGADKLPDHRHAYLDYEGPVSGNRGAVSRWDAGHYTLLRSTLDQWIVQLSGQRLDGQLTMTRGDDDPRWSVRYART